MAETYPNWVNLCLTDVRKWHSDTLNDFESMIPKLYATDTSDKQEEYDVSYSGIGNFQPLNGNVGRDSMTEEYKKTYDFPEWSNAIDIQRRLWDDRRDRSVMNMAKEFALSANRTKEAHAAEIFNYAFTATGTYSGGGSTAGPDAKALCATDHPSKASGTYSGTNTGTAAISPEAVSEMRDTMRNFTDGRDNKSYCSLDQLLVPADHDVEEVAWEIINTGGKVDTADNNRNFHKGRYKLAVWQELTSSKNWFGLDSTKAKLFLTWITRVPLEKWDSFDQESQTLTFGAYMRYGLGYSNWRWIVGNQVA
jgi:hypothetical protein